MASALRFARRSGLLPVALELPLRLLELRLEPLELELRLLADRLAVALNAAAGPEVRPRAEEEGREPDDRRGQADDHLDLDHSSNRNEGSVRLETVPDPAKLALFVPAALALLVVP